MGISVNLELNHKPKPDGQNMILIRITENRKHKRYSSGILTKKNEFNPKAKQGKWIRVLSPDHEHKNQLLEEIIKNTRKKHLELSLKGALNTPDSLIASLKGKNQYSFTSYFKDQKKRLLELGKIRTYKRYNTTYNALLDFTKKDQVFFQDISISFLNEFVHSILTRGNHQNTAYSHCKIIRALFNKAIQEDIIEIGKNPFVRFKISPVKTHKERLTIDEIKTIEKLEITPNSGVWHARNFFMFSYYNAGIRIGDLVQLQWKHIVDGRLAYNMSKTTHFKSIKLLPDAVRILKFYSQKENNPEHYIFKLLPNDIDVKDKKSYYELISSKNALVNKNLKTLANLAEIKKTVSFHVSRHSFADMARKKGANVYDISKALGHSNTKITEIYLSEFDEESLDTTMENIFK